MEEKKKERQKCDVYSRVVGYMAPVNRWNKAKVSEWKNRINFEINNNIEKI